jgi:hypothetical protein
MPISIIPAIKWHQPPTFRQYAPPIVTLQALSNNVTLRDQKWFNLHAMLALIKKGQSTRTSFDENLRHCFDRCFDDPRPSEYLSHLGRGC